MPPIKRKIPPTSAGSSKNSKRARQTNARTLRTQVTDQAFSNGELDIDKFMQARKFEILALEDGIKRSGRALTQRSHQGLPKELRRRTASHNANRVPKRLRARSKQEMRDENTPTVSSRTRKLSGHQRLRLQTAQRLQALRKKNKSLITKKSLDDQPADAKASTTLPPSSNEATNDWKVKSAIPKSRFAKLREPPLPPARFRKRQIHKTWLPTHMWHTKRARMTSPSEPVWRFALPLAPTMKSYRVSHHASATRGAIAWDMSYMSTIGLEGVVQSITGLLKSLGVGATRQPFDPWTMSGARWRSGLRSWDGWLHKRDLPNELIAPASVFWDSPSVSDEVEQVKSKKKDRRKVFIRAHPSAFLQIWDQVVRLSKVQKPSVTVEDLRFELGSIEITGPNATEALVGVLQAWSATGDENQISQAASLWQSLASTPPSCLPRNAMIHLQIGDPRLRHPPKTVESHFLQPQEEELSKMLAQWPLDQIRLSPNIFDRTARNKACRAMPTERIVNKRKRESDPGSDIERLPSDPSIPILLVATRSGFGGTGTWSVLMPWKAVNAVWRSLVYYPLSTRGVIRFGGLEQRRQLAYEAGTPWFPADFPATEAGQQWEATASAKRHTEWKRKPKSRRAEFDSLNLGNGPKGEIGAGWSCDWQRLVHGDSEARSNSNEEDVSMQDAEQDATSAKLKARILELHQIPKSTAFKALAPGSSETLPANPLSIVKITMLNRGCPSDCARIYCLPTTDSLLRQKWLTHQPSLMAPRSNTNKSRLPQRPSPNASEAEYRSWLAAMVLTELPEPGAKEYPVVPDEVDLIGFITTGNYSLMDGKGVGIGSVLLNKVLASSDRKAVLAKDISEDLLKRRKEELSLCIVRDAGETHGRLARWELL